MSIEKEFAAAIIKWYKENGRDFPWRKTKDPYRVLVAEKLLQQTSVRASLIELYELLVERYPSPQQMAKANLDELRRLIQPLGLHYRAGDLIHMSCDIQEKFDGNVPASREELLSIYGVGEYSARAVLSFAYDKDVVVVDTNVARILFRVFNLQGKFPSNPARNRNLSEIASNLLPLTKAKIFNWAMIDLGALICIPSRPMCDRCPVAMICLYFQKRAVEK